ncbi:MAG: hypothetical protein V3T88_02815 [Nitrosomonadaceae bacterium]
MHNYLWKYLNFITRPYTLYWTAAAVVVAGAVSSNQQKQAAIKAADAQRAAAAGGVSEERRQFDITQEAIEPFRQAGLGALEQQQALLGLSGQEAQQQAFQQFQESPGQQFIRQRQERALLRNQAAIGGLGGGNVRTALQQQAAGFAQQDIQNQLSRLGGIAGQGQVATTNVAQLGAGTAGNISQLLQASGQARAGGILGAGAAQSQFTQQLGGLLASQ